MRTIEAWNDLKNKYSVGDNVKGVVIDVQRFGVFVDIGEDFDALVLAPYISSEKSIKIEDYPQVGSVINGKIQVFSESSSHVNFYQIYISMID